MYIWTNYCKRLLSDETVWWSLKSRASSIYIQIDFNSFSDIGFNILVKFSSKLFKFISLILYLDLILLYCRHSIKKWISFSIFPVQNLQNLSLDGIFGLAYLPVSIANECALILNLVSFFLRYLGILKFKYSCCLNLV